MRGILARHLPGAALALGIAFMGVLAVPASAARAADPVDFDLVATTSCG